MIIVQTVVCNNRKGDFYMALINVVRFNGLQNRDWIIYKYPSESLVLGSQLIVQEGQAAIFVKSGLIADIFYPGTYTLVSDNLPLLQKFINLPFGGTSPFSSEVYFINTAVHLDINWGTIDPIQLIDPKFHIKLRIRAFGQMGLRILDAQTFFKDVVGAMPNSDLVKCEKIKEYYRGILVLKAKSILADTIINNGISALEISTKLESLSQTVKEQVESTFKEYGFAIENFYIQSINFPDEDFEKINKILEDKAAFDILGDSKYITKRSFDIYEGAANNSSGVAGAFAAGGIGIGTAMGMGTALNQTVGNPLQNTNTKTCISCGKQIDIMSKYCPICGADNNEIVCECGNKLAPGTKFCPQCGKKVSDHEE